MWHFLDLNHEQKLERRRLLDLYGSLAQVSAVIPLALLQLYFVATWLQRRWLRKSGADAIPSSPHLKKQQSDALNGPMVKFRCFWQQAMWWMGDTIDIFGSRMGKGEILSSLIWTAWLIFLSCVQTQGGTFWSCFGALAAAKHLIDYLHLTKRFGIVGASQLPLQYLLAFKSPFSPIQHLTGCSWTTLNAAHQILGRVSTILFYLHAGFYLNFFIQAHVLAKRIKDWDVILGIVGTIAFTAVGTTALSWVRRLSYRIFYTTHVTLASILLPVLYFHVHHIRVYIIETLMVYAVHLALRILNEHKVEGSLTLVPGTSNLLEINIPLTTRSKQKSIMEWQPGQHVYISLARGPVYMRSLKSRSPFTIASLPSEDGNLKLAARILDGNTAALAKAATEGATGKATSIPLILEGPYGLSTYPNTLLQYNRVLFIAGGVGATFIVPLYRTLLRDLSPSPGSRRRQNVAFVWVVRDEAETSWAVPEDEQEQKGMQERMSIYATRSGRSDGEKPKTDDTDEGIELERLLPDGGADDSGTKWQINPGRPDLGEMVDGVFNHTRNDTKVAVVVCGPRLMADEIRRKSSKWVGKRDVWLHVEGFGL
jgi:ferredoxin-NADP reductase